MMMMVMMMMMIMCPKSFKCDQRRLIFQSDRWHDSWKKRWHDSWNDAIWQCGGNMTLRNVSRKYDNNRSSCCQSEILSEYFYIQSRFNIMDETEAKWMQFCCKCCVTCVVKCNPQTVLGHQHCSDVCVHQIHQRQCTSRMDWLFCAQKNSTQWTFENVHR